MADSYTALLCRSYQFSFSTLTRNAIHRRYYVNKLTVITVMFIIII